MKNKLANGVMIAAITLLPLVSQAKGEERSTSTRATTTEGRIKAKIGELENKKDALRENLEDARDNAVFKVRQGVERFNQKMTVRFQAAVDRLTKLSLRIESRINKMQAANQDVAKAKELLEIAKTKIETAKTSAAKLSALEKSMATSTASTTASIKDEFKNFQTALQTAKKDLKAAHSALVDVIKNLKPGQNKARTASSTNATSTED